MFNQQQLEQALAAQDQLVGVLPDSMLDTIRTALRSQLEELVSETAPRRKQVTVLFADLSGFTAAAEQMDAEDVSHLLNTIWEQVDTLIRAHGGWIDKHIGDAVIAIWGAGQGREDDAERAVQAGLEILKSKIAASPPVSFPAALPVLNFRVGIHTGLVLLGTIGLTHEPTAMGSAIHTANRLQSAAAVDTLLISSSTYDLVRGLFKMEPAAPLQTQGKNDLLRAYRVMEAYPRTYRMQRRGIEGVRAPFIGREAEWNDLCAAYQSAQAKKQMGIVVLIAEGGMGKSRLMDEFENRFAGPALAFHGRADPQRQNLPYAMIRDLFTNFCDIQETDSPAEARHKLEITWLDWLGETGEESAAPAGHLLGFDFSNSPGLRGLLHDPRQLRHRAFLAIQRFFRAVSERAPVILYLDDLHWVDAGSLEFLFEAAQSLVDTPIFILIAARPILVERFPDWNLKLPAATCISLHALSLENTRALAWHILQRVPDLPSTLLAQLAQNAEGNPFYLEELIQMLIEQGVIQPDPSEWQIDAHRLQNFPIPPSLTGVLQSRLDHLEPGENFIIQSAAVFGRIFWNTAVATLAGVTLSETDQALERLCTKGLVEPRESSTIPEAREFTFKQSTLQEVAYERVLKANRTAYHHQIAEWLVTQNRGSSFEYASLITQHYEKAGETFQAAIWQTRAGDQALAAYLQASACQAYQHVLELLGASLDLPLPAGIDPVVLLPIYENLYEVFDRQGRPPEAKRAAMAMLEAARAIPDPAAEVRALCNCSSIEKLLSNPRSRHDFIELAEKAAFAMSVPDPALQARVLWSKAALYMTQARYTDAMCLLEQVIPLAQQAGDRERLGSTYNLIGLAHMHEGHSNEARIFLTQALEIQRSLGQQNYEAALLNNLGEACRFERNYDQALDYYRQALACYQKVGNLEGGKLAQNNMGGILVTQKNYLEAVKLLLAVLQPPQSGVYLQAETRRFLAEAYFELGQTEQSFESARQAVICALQSKNPSQLGPAWRFLGTIAGELERTVEIPFPDSGELHPMTALECFQTSLEVLNVEGHHMEYADTLRAIECWRARHPGAPEAT